MMSSKYSNTHIYGFDYLRGLACIGVMLFHYTVQYEHSFGRAEYWPIKFFGLGRCGVIVFFIISAYLALMHIKDDDTIFSYGFKRMIRLYPAYWTGIVLTTITTYFLLPQYSRTFPEILVNLTMLQGFLNIRAVDGVYWTLQLELIFYAIVGALILFKLRKHTLKISFLWILILYICNYLPDDMLVVKVLNVLVMKGNGHIFIIGIAAYYINKDKSVLNIIQCAVMMLLCWVYSFIYCSVWESCFVILLTFLIIFITEYKIKPIKALAGFEYLSKISYPLYLTHQFIGFAIIKNMESIGLVSEVYIIIPIAVSVVLASLIHKYIEVPMADRLRRLCIKS